MRRYLEPRIIKDLAKKMVFLGGPRQVGKTTLSKQLMSSFEYYNWDIDRDRRVIIDQDWKPSSKLLVLDEIHKFRKWRNYVKGLYDDRSTHLKQILVTGSARLDYYRFGGDSLQGRYHYWKLHPLSVGELKIQNQTDLMELFNLGPFPEPFLTSSKSEADRWSLEYRTRLGREDVQDLEGVQDIGQIEMLVKRLPDLVSSPLSINSLREDLDVSYRSVKRWIEILERFYSIFRIKPFVKKNKLRAVKKEQKHYHFDWNLVQNKVARFENMVASHLLKWVDFRVDYRGEDLELNFFRDTDGREVDFVVTKNFEPILVVECKFLQDQLSRDLVYFKNKFPKASAWQVYMDGTKDVLNSSGIRHTHVLNLLREFEV